MVFQVVCVSVCMPVNKQAFGIYRGFSHYLKAENSYETFPKAK